MAKSVIGDSGGGRDVVSIRCYMVQAERVGPEPHAGEKGRRQE